MIASNESSASPLRRMFGVTSLVAVELMNSISVQELWHQLEPRERAVASNFLRRLFAGQVAFGPLTKGKKDWRREAKEEALDMAVYLAAELEDDYEDG